MFGCGDGGKSEKTADNGNDSGRETGSLYGECYPNETCDKGLECDVENNICVKETEKSEEPTNSDREPENSENKPDAEAENPDNDSDSNADPTSGNDADTQDPETPVPDDGDSTNDKDNDYDTSDTVDTKPDADTSDTGNGDNDELPECSLLNQTPCKDSASGLTWSAYAKNMRWDEAVEYCKDLSEGGFSDWHLPTIAELRTLIQNCPSTITGGSCGVTDNCLNDNCWSEAACHDNTCYSSDNKLNKFGDTNYFWSSSTKSDDTDDAWIIWASFAYIEHDYKFLSKYYNVRCVRTTGPATPDSGDSESKPESGEPCNENGAYMCGGKGSYQCLLFNETQPTWYMTDYSCDFGCDKATGKCRNTPPNCSKSLSPCKDSATQLIWSREHTYVTWDSAVSYCTNLDEGTYDDWRMPTISELRTLILNCPSTEPNGECGVTDNCLNSACHTDGCHSCSSGSSSSKLDDGVCSFLWSSSTYVDDETSAWFVDHGYVSNLNKNYDAFAGHPACVRCVRKADQ